MKKLFSPNRIFKTLLAISAVLALPALYQTWGHMQAEGYLLWRSARTFLLAAFLLNALGLYALAFFNPDDILRKSAEKFPSKKWMQALSGLFFFIFALIPALVIALDPNQFFLPGYSVAWLAWWLAIFASILVSLTFRARLDTTFALILLMMGFFARLEVWTTFISTYPFSLGWSEASRYYYASLFYGEQIYGQATAWSFLHPTRYLLQSIPFLFGQMSLWFHRVWQVALWFVLTFGAGMAFARRLPHKRKALLIPLALWFFIFSLQGAVYYHLQVVVIIVLLGMHGNDFKRSTLVLILASLWAGISRVNWIPVPAMLVIFLYLLEEPVSSYKNLWDYLKKPIAWTTLGIGAALASQSIYVFISGNSDNIRSFGSSFTSSLLWYRLLPNATYRPGIILATAFIAFPAVGLIFDERTPKHWIRKLGTWSILLVLLLGGLVVSTKIGGGADLHNMDAFMVVLALWAGYAFVGGVKGEASTTGHTPSSADPLWVAFAVAVPVWLALSSLVTIPNYDMARASRNFDTIQDFVANADGDVLFISQRHLLTLGMVEPVALEPDYEVVELMEMAMSGNELYLNNFYDDIFSQRFALIIADPQFVVIKESGAGFAEENNAWALKVSEPLLCTYRPLDTMKRSGIVIFEPRPGIKEGCDPR